MWEAFRRDSVNPTEIGRELGEELLTIFFLAVLALAWMSVILPAALRARKSAPMSTAERFKRRMALIAPPTRSGGRWIVIPESSRHVARDSFHRAQERRIRILATLIAGVGISGLAAFVLGGRLWSINLLFDASLLAFAALLLEAKRRREERTRKVRTLRRPAAAEPSFWEPARAHGGSRN